jgi:hypothetical protein
MSSTYTVGTDMDILESFKLIISKPQHYSIAISENGLRTVGTGNKPSKPVIEQSELYSKGRSEL